jgi:hypothetical protein
MVKWTFHTSVQPDISRRDKRLVLSVESPLWHPPVSSQSGNQKGNYNHCCWMLSTGYYRSSWSLFAVLQFYNLTVVKRLKIVFRKRNVKSCASSYLHRYVSELKDIFTADGELLFCRAYGKCLVAWRRSQITQYLRGSKHVAVVVVLEVQPGM